MGPLGRVGLSQGAWLGSLSRAEVWGRLKGSGGTTFGARTYLGRVLRCFEWFRDLVDPWRTR